MLQEYDKCRQLGENLELDGVISIGTGEPNETVRRYESGKSLSHRSRHIRDMATLLIEQVSKLLEQGPSNMLWGTIGTS